MADTLDKKLISIADRLPYERRMPVYRNLVLLRCVKHNAYNTVDRLRTWHELVDTTSEDPYKGAS